MSSGILGTAISGLLSFQQGLNTAGHNIANVNTEGYSRQRVEFTTRLPQRTGIGFIGSGVEVSNVSRVYDQYLVNQLRMSSSTFAELDSFHTLASRIDNFMAEQETSVATVLQSFFNAVQEVANDPTSIPARQVLLSEASTLTDRFVGTDKMFDDLRSEINQSLTGAVTEINDLASSIAELNEQISAALGATDGKPPNDLLDQRDVLLKRLAEKVDVTTVAQDDGKVNVFIGNGQALVLGSTAAELGVQRSGFDASQLDITFKASSGSPVVVTRHMSGGEVGGTLRFREEVLDPAQRQLGVVAAGLVEEFNQLHRLGYDLSGGASGTGNDFFAPLKIDVLGQSGSATAVFNANAQDLKASDYSLTVDAAGTTFTLTRLSDKQVVGSNATGTFSVDGMDISVSGVSGGESFLIRPALSVSGQMAVNITDPKKIAAAAGDTASGSIGDNEIALKLSGLQNRAILLGSSTTLHDAFGQIVVDVGAKTRSADINRSAQEAVLNQAMEAREALSGVNLDEEAANLVKFQQAYQAAAQLVGVANTLFDTLLGTFRR
ncbi:MAG: flagellar hook-associated protein FlgK [Pseudomonadota bacterium]